MAGVDAQRERVGAGGSVHHLGVREEVGGGQVGVAVAAAGEEEDQEETDGQRQSGLC